MGLTPQEQANRERLRLSKPKVYDKVMRYEERYARGESVAVMQLQYNYVCNMKCVHCSITPFQKHGGRRLTPADVKNLCDQADEYGLAQIDLTGGEPLAFKDLDDVIRAIDPSRFFLMVDTNGWMMTEEKVKHLKDLGVDKIQISLDSLDGKAHDDFRRKPGTFERVLRAIKAVKDAGLTCQVSSVVTPERVHSAELEEFLQFTDAHADMVNLIPAKLVGEWAHRTDLLVSDADMDYLINDLAVRHRISLHLQHHHGVDYGCIAVKKIFTVTGYGDVLPCIWMYLSLGNIFDTPLE